MTTKTEQGLRAVSLFSNCGAGDVGYARSGFRFDVIAELVPHRLAVAKLNHPRAAAIQGDLTKSLPQVVEAWRERQGNARPALLAACPPCQGMSSARSGRGREDDAEAGSRDPRNLLVQVIAEAVDELAPRVVVVENVPAFLTRRVTHPATAEPVSAAVLLIDQLQADYCVFPIVSDLADFGIPQQRRRCFLTFVRRDEAALVDLDQRELVPYPDPTQAGDHVSAASALDALGLRALDASDASSAADPEDPMHFVPVWSRERYAMVAAIPPDSGGSAWENTECLDCGQVDVAPVDLRCPKCARPLLRPIVATGGDVRFVRGFRTSSYTRMHPERPAATVTTASGHVGSDKTIHPSQNRVLSPLECAALQTFPADFKWGDALKVKGHTNVREMIGEAVPPAFTRQHGRVLAAVLNGSRPYLYMSALDARVTRATRSLTSARTTQVPVEMT